MYTVYIYIYACVCVYKFEKEEETKSRTVFHHDDKASPDIYMAQRGQLGNRPHSAVKEA